jgi:hypothetical protein
MARNPHHWGHFRDLSSANQMLENGPVMGGMLRVKAHKIETGAAHDFQGRGTQSTKCAHHQLTVKNATAHRRHK